MCCFTFLTVSKESLGFGWFVGQKKQLEDFSLGSGILDEQILHFFDNL